MKQFLFLIILLTSQSNYSLAQTLTHHTSHENIRDFLVFEDHIWFATNGGVVQTDLDGNLIQKFTLLDGLGHSSLHFIAISSRNTICVGSYSKNEIYEYTNQRWSPYPMPVLADKKKSYFAVAKTSRGELVLYNRASHEYINHNIAPSIYIDHPDGWKEFKSHAFISLEGSSMQSIMYNQDKIWFQQINDLVFHDGDTTVISKGDARGFLLTKEGVMYRSPNRFYLWDEDEYKWNIVNDEYITRHLSKYFMFTGTDNNSNTWLYINRSSSSRYLYNLHTNDSIPLPTEESSYDESIRFDKHNNPLLYKYSQDYIMYYRNNEWKKIELSPTEIEPPRYISRSFRDSLNNIWLAGWERSLQINTHTDSYHSYSRPRSVTKVVYDSLGTKTIWGWNSIFYYDSLNTELDGGAFGGKTHQYVGKTEAEGLDVFIGEGYPSGLNLYFFDKTRKVIAKQPLPLEYSHRAYGLQTNDNTVWLIEGSNIIQYDTKDSLKNFKINTHNSSTIFNLSHQKNSSVAFLYEDNQERLWVGFYISANRLHSALAYWQDTTWHIIENCPSFNLNNVYPEEILPPITEDSKGNIYVAAHNAVYKWDGENWISHVEWDKLVPGSSVHKKSLYCDKDDYIWVISEETGISRCRGNNCETILDKERLRVVDIYENEDGSFWIVTYEDGIFRYTPE